MFHSFEFSWGGVRAETSCLLGTTCQQAPEKVVGGAVGASWEILAKHGGPLLRLANKRRLVQALLYRPWGPGEPSLAVFLPQKTHRHAPEGPFRGHPPCPGVQAGWRGAAAPDTRRPGPGVARRRPRAAARAGGPAHNALRGQPFLRFLLNHPCCALSGEAAPRGGRAPSRLASGSASSTLSPPIGSLPLVTGGYASSGCRPRFHWAP